MAGAVGLVENLSPSNLQKYFKGVYWIGVVKRGRGRIGFEVIGIIGDRV
jgi:hypothetical protein